MKREDAKLGDGTRVRTPGAVARAIRQARPFRSESQEATLGVLLAAERLRQRTACVLEPWGITIQQYNVLRILRGVHPDPLPTLEVAARMIEKTPGVTRLIDRIEAKGWVSRERCRSDRRQVHCAITTAGLALLDEIDDVVNQVDDALSREFTIGELRTLIGLVERVIEPSDH